MAFGLVHRAFRRGRGMVWVPVLRSDGWTPATYTSREAADHARVVLEDHTGWTIRTIPTDQEDTP